VTDALEGIRNFSGISSHAPYLACSSSRYTLSEAWSAVNGADLMAAQGAFETDFYDRSTITIVGMMLWTEYRPVIKIGPKVALGSNEIRPIHSAPSLGQSVVLVFFHTAPVIPGVGA